ncbi:IPT/TIG domain-containing protein [Embleya sp. NPDC005971]|uniref:IPT/TIG domain-containing protein n=1 Tax=Embleya sp. NPDC005971 TaxID=3156724 RepID=UPI0033DFADF8
MSTARDTRPQLTEPPTPGTGPSEGGVSVILVGVHLDHVNKVTFDGLDATDIKPDGSTRVSCVAPPGGAGPVPVIAFDDTGTATNPESFTYVPPA